MRRKEITICIVLLAVVSLAISSFCTAAEKPKLLVWYGKTFVSASDETFVKNCNEFAREKNIDIEVVLTPWGDLPSKWAAAIEAKTPPDVAILREHEPAKFQYLGELLELTDLYAELDKKAGGFFKLGFEAVTIEGKKWAIPKSFESEAIYYRKDILAAKGLKAPNTWDDMRQIALKTTTPEIYGMGFQLSRCTDFEKFFRSLKWSFGATAVDKTGKNIIFNSPKTLKALTFVTDLYLKDKVIPPGATTWDDGGNNKAYQGKQVVMIENTASVLYWMRKNDPDLLSKTGFAPMPKGPAGRFGFSAPHYLGVTKRTKYPDLAKDLIRYLMEPSKYEKWIEVGMPMWQPVYKDLAKRPLWQDPENAMFLEQVKYSHIPGYPGPPSPAANEIWDRYIYADMVQRVIVDKWDPQKALDEATERIKGIYKTWQR